MNCKDSLVVDNTGQLHPLDDKLLEAGNMLDICKKIQQTFQN